MNVAVISTFYNRQEKTLACIKSIYEQVNLPPNTKIELYFCDDGSTDGTSNYIIKDYPDVNIIMGTGNLFWARGMYLPFRNAVNQKYDFYLMVNDDVEFNSDMLETMFRSYRKNEDKAALIAVVGSTKDAEGNWTYGGQEWNKRIFHEKYEPVLPQIPCRECNMANWNCFLIPHQMVEQLGIIDNYYEHAKADNDYSNRIIDSGNKIFVADRYIGKCERNSIENTWRDTSLSLKRRLELVKKTTGLPIKSEIYYCKKFHGKVWWAWVCKRYAWIYISALKNIRVRGDKN